MLIRDTSRPIELDRVKEVKVKIPVSYHIRLHSMKVLTGKQISDAVKEALDAYFTAIEDGRLPSPLADVAPGPRSIDVAVAASAKPAPGIAFPSAPLDE